MSWSVGAGGKSIEETIETLRAKPAPSNGWADEEAAEQFHGAVDAAATLLESGAFGQLGTFRVMLSGHASPGHAAPGNTESITVVVSRSPD